MKGVYVFLADGFEETEAIATLDVLRRGGVDVKTVSITERNVVSGSHWVPVTADLTFGEFKYETELKETTKRDVMIFPGGMPGTKNLAAKTELMDIMKEHYASGGTVAAICAAPGLVVSQLPSLKGKKFTCFDGFEEAPKEKGGEYVKSAAVSDGNLITGRGAGCAVEFGLAILNMLEGPEAVAKVRYGMMI